MSPRQQRRRQGALGSSSGGPPDRKNPDPLGSLVSGGEGSQQEWGQGKGGYPPFPLYITRLYMFPLLEAGWFMGRGAGVVGGERGIFQSECPKLELSKPALYSGSCSPPG